MWNTLKKRLAKNLQRSASQGEICKIVLELKKHTANA